MPEADGASPGIQPPNRPSLCCRKPEQALVIEVQVLWSELAALRRPKRKEAKRLPSGIKAPDVVGIQLSEPGVTLCIDGRGHDAISPFRRFPAGHDACLRVEATEAVDMHIADPDMALRIHGWLHQADVGLGKEIEIPLRGTHGRRDGGGGSKMHPHLSHGRSVSHRSSHGALTRAQSTTPTTEHEQCADSEQRQYKASL